MREPTEGSIDHQMLKMQKIEQELQRYPAMVEQILKFRYVQGRRLEIRDHVLDSQVAGIPAHPPYRSFQGICVVPSLSQAIS